MKLCLKKQTKTHKLAHKICIKIKIYMAEPLKGMLCGKYISKVSFMVEMLTLK
jgi:hypothetical protein